MDNDKGWLIRSLPAVYQENSENHDFLRRFLDIFETKFQESERFIDEIPLYFDPDTTHGVFLVWLASWLSLDYYEALGEENNRRLIQNAMKLYELKGTRKGLTMLVNLLIGEDCEILESINNIFQSYEHGQENISKVINANRDFKKYEAHYTYDASDFGPYSVRAVHLRVPKSEQLSEEQLQRIIGPFLPMHVTLHIDFIGNSLT